MIDSCDSKSAIEYDDDVGKVVNSTSDVVVSIDDNEVTLQQSN